MASSYRRSFGKISFKGKSDEDSEQILIDQKELNKYEAVCMLRRKLTRLFARCFSQLNANSFMFQERISKLSKLFTLLSSKAGSLKAQSFESFKSLKRKTFPKYKYGASLSSRLTLKSMRELAVSNMFRILNSRRHDSLLVGCYALRSYAQSLSKNEKALLLIHKLQMRKIFRALKEGRNEKERVHKFFSQLKRSSPTQECLHSAFVMLSRLHVFYFTRVHESFVTINENSFSKRPIATLKPCLLYTSPSPRDS